MKPSKKGSERYERLMPAGVPKWVRCYDNGGETIDRYTCVFTKKAIKTQDYPYKGVTMREFGYLCMSYRPMHPQGVGMWGTSKWTPVDRPTSSHLGKKIKFEKLSEDCQTLVISDYKELWDLE